MATINLDVIKRSNPTDEYELMQKVGSGTYGEVYKAKQVASGQMAAIKVVKLEPGDDFRIIQQEIFMMQDCRHANIVAYYGSYLRRDKLWIAMEYCGGGSLQDIYRMTGPLSELQIAFVCRETLKGIQYLHGMGKIHRDIKGANILLTTDGYVKLADFGVAAQITATIGKRKSLIGTPYWMAPEMAMAERKGGYNQLCDVWAVGITSIELAELEPPWFDLHPMRVLHLMTKSSYKPPNLREKIKWSPSFHDFVKQCLQRNPKKRPAPEKLLSSHPFVMGNLSNRLTRDLLDRVNNTSANRAMVDQDLTEDEEAGPSNMPHRIPSRTPADGDFGNNLRPLQTSNPNDDTQWGVVDKPIKLLDEINLQLSNKEPVREGAPEHSLVEREHPQVIRYRQMHEDMCKSAHDQSTILVDKSQTPPDLIVGHGLVRCMADSDCSDDGNETLRRDGTLTRFEATPEGSSDSESYIPPVAPDRKKKNKLKSSSFRKATNATDLLQNEDGPARPASFSGLPPTPKVTMGACFSKVFHGCPLRINMSASWIHPDTKDQRILLATEEGIYTLNLSKIHDQESCLERLHPRRSSWLYVVDNVLMAVQGRTPHLYHHDIVALHQRDFTNRLSLPMNKLPSKFVPRKLSITCRFSETRGCLKCCVQRNPYNGSKFLCAAVPSGVILMQWYEPLSKFLILKQVECKVPLPLDAFEMILSPGEDYPIICTGVRKGNDRKHLVYDNVDLNSESRSRCHEELDRLEVTALKQLEKDVVLVAYNNKVQVTNLDGRLKSSRLSHAELVFPFRISSVVCLDDSVLAFHRHGMHGRSFKDNITTQDISDPTNVYRVLGNDKVVVLEARNAENAVNGVDLCILTGHESTF